MADFLSDLGTLLRNRPGDASRQEDVEEQAEIDKRFEEAKEIKASVMEPGVEDISSEPETPEPKFNPSGKTSFTTEELMRAPFSPKNITSIGKPATKELMAEVAQRKMDSRNLPLLPEYTAWREAQSEKHLLDKSKGFFKQAWEMAGHLVGEANLAAAAVVDASRIPTFLVPGTAERIQEVRRDPDERTTVRQAATSVGDAALLWGAQLGTVYQNSMDSVTGGVYERIANTDEPVKRDRLTSALPDPAVFPFKQVLDVARKFLPEDYEIDTEIEIRLEHARLGRIYERERLLPQEGESLIGATRTVAGLAAGESNETAVEAGERMSADVIEPLRNTTTFAFDFLLPVGAGGIAARAMKHRALVPSTASRAIVNSAGRSATGAATGAATATMPRTLRAAQKLDNWLRETATPKVDRGIRKIGSGGPSLASGIFAISRGASALGTVGAFAAPYAARGALYMGFGAIKWTGRSSRDLALPFARALKAKHEFGLAGPQNAGMWARVAADTKAPGWARNTAGVANRMLSNPKMRQIIGEGKAVGVGAVAGGITEGLQEMLEEAIQTGATAESMGGGFGAGVMVGGAFGAGAGFVNAPKDIDGLMMDIDALHYRQRLVERGDDVDFYDNKLTQQQRRDIAASQGAAIDSADVRLVTGETMAKEVSEGARKLAEGVFRSKNGEVLINTEIVTPDRVARVVAHEIGHASYYGLPQELKDEWRKIAFDTYGEAEVEAYRQKLDNDRQGLGEEVTMDVALDEMYSEQFLGANSSGRELLTTKRKISGGYGVDRTLRRIHDSILSMMGIHGPVIKREVTKGMAVKGRMLFEPTPYSADPAIENFIHRTLRDLGAKHKPPPLPAATPPQAPPQTPPSSATPTPPPTSTPPLNDQEAAVVGDAIRATNGPGSVVEIGNGKHIVILEPREDGTLNVFDLDLFEQAIRDLPPDDTRSHRARVAAALEQAKTGVRDRDPDLADLVEALTKREPARRPPSPETVETILQTDADLPQSAPPLTPEEAADPLGTAEQTVPQSQLTDQELGALFPPEADVEFTSDTPEQRELKRRRQEERQFKKEIIEKEDIPSIVENAQPSQLKGAKRPGDDRYATHARTVDPSDIRAIAGRTLSAEGRAATNVDAGTDVTGGTPVSRHQRVYDEVNAIKSAAPILSPQNQRKARLASESRFGGTEHRVLIEPGDPWATKVWRPGRRSSPFGYLTRLGLQNKFFRDNIQVLGIYDGQIVTRQPFYESVNGIPPTVLEIREYMAEHGFRADRPGLLDRATLAFLERNNANPGMIEYSNGTVRVSDAHPDNFIRKVNGELQLIDGTFTIEDRSVGTGDRFALADTPGQVPLDDASLRFAPASQPGEAPQPGRTPGVLPSDRAQEGGLPGRRGMGGSESGVQTPYSPYPPTSTERPLDNLASTVTVDGRKVEFGPFPVAREAARAYMQQAGLPYNPPTDYVRVDKERATRIADEYERMEHAPNNPEVKAAYRAMIDETLAQYEAIKDTGLVIEPNPPGTDPYGNPRNAILDVVENNHMWFFPTLEGFGGPASADVDISGNPLLEPTGEVINGHEMVANDVFRVVHDYFGHVKEGVGFRADGEENAWRSHSSMYSDLARRAMTTETRGQNSWVNFGPFGEQNQTANGSDTEYAPQKIGILPEWAIEEGRDSGDRFAPIDPEKREAFQSFTDQQKENLAANIDRFGWVPEEEGMTRQEFETFVAPSRAKDLGRIEATRQQEEMNARLLEEARTAPPKITRVSKAKLNRSANLDDDGYFYHIAPKAAASNILKSQEIAAGKEQAMAPGFYADYSKDKVFLTDRSRVEFWDNRIQEHLESQGRPTNTVVLRVPKNAVSGVEVDSVGTRDANAPSWFVPGTLKPVSAVGDRFALANTPESATLGDAESVPTDQTGDPTQTNFGSRRSGPMGPEQARKILPGNREGKPWDQGGLEQIGELDAQDEALGQWAQENGLFFDSDAVARIKSQAKETDGGSEHNVFLMGDRVIRMTKDNMFGMPFRTPAQYLRRWELSNQLFPNSKVEVEFLGYAKDSLGNGIIITQQPLIRGEIGSRKDITNFFAEHGFRPMKGIDHAYIRDADGIEIYDAHGGNVLFDESGQAFPIDVLVIDRRGVMTK